MLNKQICKKCVNRKRHLSGFYIPWNNYDEERIENEQCCMFLAQDFEGSVPVLCVFKLEQIVVGQKNVK